MNEYDQERFTEMAEELDAAREKIKCLEAELAEGVKLLKEAMDLIRQDNSGLKRN
jgi:hypothetical protein